MKWVEKLFNLIEIAGEKFFKTAQNEYLVFEC